MLSGRLDYSNGSGSGSFRIRNPAWEALTMAPPSRASRTESGKAIIRQSHQKLHRSGAIQPFHPEMQDGRPVPLGHGQQSRKIAIQGDQDSLVLPGSIQNDGIRLTTKAQFGDMNTIRATLPEIPGGPSGQPLIQEEPDHATLSGRGTILSCTTRAA